MPGSAETSAPTKRVTLFLPSACDSLRTCEIRSVHKINRLSSHFCVNVGLKAGSVERNTAAMVDSGATKLFMGEQYVWQLGIRTYRLKDPIDVYNIDGSPNVAGRIT